MTSNPTVLVVDFGAQYAQLIARRVREASVYSEIVAHDLTAAEYAAMEPAGIIFSGGPASVNIDGAPRIDPGIYELGVPIQERIHTRLKRGVIQMRRGGARQRHVVRVVAGLRTHQLFI